VAEVSFAADMEIERLSRSQTSIIYEATGNLGAVRILLGHAKINGAVRYVGVGVGDALELSERTEV